MIYLWEEPEILDKYTAIFNWKLSTEQFLLRRGENISLDDFSRCNAYLRSQPLDLEDDHFVRCVLRPTFHSAYIFTPKNLYFCGGGIVASINVVNQKYLNSLIENIFTTKDIDGSPKALTDEQLQKIYQIEGCPRFSRIPLFEAEVTKSALQKFDSIPNTSGSPLVNQKVIDLLLKLVSEDDLQFFDAEIHCKDGVLAGYKLVNIIPKIIGIDHEKSIYSKILNTEAILGFKYLTYKPGCMGNYNLARDEEYFPIILVTEDFKNAFETAKIKGVWFVRPEDFYRPMRPEDLID